MPQCRLPVGGALKTTRRIFQSGTSQVIGSAAAREKLGRVRGVSQQGTLGEDDRGM